MDTAITTTLISAPGNWVSQIVLVEYKLFARTELMGYACGTEPMYWGWG